MRVMQRLAHLDEQLQALDGAEIVLVAELGDGHALHQLHDEVRPAGFGRAAVEHLGDVRVVHHRQRLPLGLEAAHHLPRVHPQLDDLEGDATLHRFALFGHVNNAKAAFADFLQQLVTTDRRARTFRHRNRTVARRDRGGLVGVAGFPLEKITRVTVRREQAGQPIPQSRVMPGKLIEQRPPRRVGLTIEQLIEKLSFVGHRPDKSSPVANSKPSAANRCRIGIASFKSLAQWN